MCYTARLSYRGRYTSMPGSCRGPRLATQAHTMNVLSPFISVLCHSDWLFHGESCPRLDVVHPGRAWSSSPACTWHCSLHYLFLHATPLFSRGVTAVCCNAFLTSAVVHVSLGEAAQSETYKLLAAPLSAAAAAAGFAHARGWMTVTRTCTGSGAGWQ